MDLRPLEAELRSADGLMGVTVLCGASGAVRSLRERSHSVTGTADRGSD